jgi:hypothetical protein
VVGVATTGGAPRGLSREQECELDGEWALAHPGWIAYPGGITSAHGRRYADELDLGQKLARRGGLALPGVRMRVSRCTGARGCVQRSTRMHTDVKTVAAATRRPDKRTGKAKKGRRAWCSCGGVGNGTCKRLLPSLARRPASHSATARRRDGNTTRRSWVSVSMTRRPGAIGGRDEDVLTYGLRDQKVKAAVKKRSVRQRGGRRRR